MPLNYFYIDTYLLPHTCSKILLSTKAMWKRRYANLKRKICAGAIVTVGVVNTMKFARDIAASKLKAYGYKALFATAVGPVIQVAGAPLYIYLYGTKFANMTIAIVEIGAKITKSEMKVLNWG